MRIRDWSSDVCSSDLPVASKIVVGREKLKPVIDKIGILVCIINGHVASFKDDVWLDRPAGPGPGCRRATARSEIAGLRERAPARIGSRIRDSFFGRSAERGVGKGGVSTCRSRWSP